MTTNMDANRINFSELNIEDKASELGLLERIKPFTVHNAGSYKGVPVDLNCEENKEPLVDVKDFGVRAIPYYLEQAQYNPTYGTNIKGAPDVLYAREGTCKRMQEVNQDLEPLGLELICYDAHRSPLTQKKLFDSFVKIANNKGLQGEEAKEFALTYCSNPEGFNAQDPKTWTIHSTGGAVDVYLFDKKSSKVVDMGEGFFDNPDEVTHTRYLESANDKSPLKGKERGNMMARRLLHNVMSKHEFINFGSEAFHFSYKDPYSAFVKGKSAQYGYTKSPKEVALERLMGGVMQNKFGK